MDVTVYLPDEIGLWAKQRGVNTSRTLRDELEAMMTRETAMEAALDGAAEVRLDLIDSEGRAYVGRFTGDLVVEGNGQAVYLTEDQRILLHDWKNDSLHELEDAEEELRERLNNEDYIAACNVLGNKPIVDI